MSVYVLDWHLKGLYLIHLKAVSNICKNIYRPHIQVTLELYGHFRCLQVLFPNKSTFTKHCLTQSSQGALSMAIPRKFYGSGSHSKCNSLQDQANFYRSWAYQIVLIFNTVEVISQMTFIIILLIFFQVCLVSPTINNAQFPCILSSSAYSLVR